MTILRCIFFELPSNFYFFPLLQFALLALLFFAGWRDWRAQRAANGGSRAGGMSGTPSPTFGVTGSDADLTATRGPATMSTLERVTGLVIAAIITVMNKSVFDDNEAGWKHYSAVFNAFDLIAIIYLCYLSKWGRSHIIARIERLRHERS
jgi:hypothetical protein